MSNPWFRFYAAALRNPKVATLSDREFRLWISLLAAASENDGCLPPAKDLKHLLNARLDHLLTGVERLISVGLIDRLEHGYTPHNWNKFQYKSDTSTERVQKHRAVRNVSETPPDTEQIQKQKIEPRAQQISPAARNRWDELLDHCLKAAGLDGFRAERSPKLADLSALRGLLDKGYSLETDILPAIRDKAAAGHVFTNWAYIVPVVIERTSARNAIPERQAAPETDWHSRVQAWRQDPGNWIHAWGPPPGERGCKVPNELLSKAA